VQLAFFKEICDMMAAFAIWNTPQISKVFNDGFPLWALYLSGMAPGVLCWPSV